MEINSNMVRELREKTGCGMMDCKRAIIKSGGNLDEAEKMLLSNPRRNCMVTYKPKTKEEHLKAFAKMIDGREHNYPQFTKEEIEAAKANGFVIVYGASDDLIEFEGAICDEGGCYEGGNIFFNRKGILYEIGGSREWEPNIIKAVWCGGEKDENGKEITWTYETVIPHETFMIYKYEEPYCRGIIFSIDDVR